MPGEKPSGARFGFAREQRLQKAWEFEETRREGQRLVRGSLVLNWRWRSDRTQSRLGVVTSKKIGGAVVRSRARRLLREVFRLNQHRFRGPADIVLIARNSIAGKPCSEVERDFLGAARQAKLIGAEES